ncbi:class I SAM-dependent methyltransferase [Actinopolymorpha sp. NPDC004070]|uniref:class I SAM-dependent methyltransferase n=1 Tax=Actinopolymorpha sp. NPDC004070 TaxID=3154548 RepID=UPI0033A63434
MTSETNVRIIDRRAPEDHGRAFLPGAGKTWLLPFYDLFSRVADVRRLHERVAQLAEIAPGQTVVDVGCGTGNLSFAVLAAQPAARVTGLDPDDDALRRAARKARRRDVSLTLVQGYADRIPAEDATLDHVVSSLALHHVDDDGRTGFANDALRALRPGGKVTIVDFGGPASGTDGANSTDSAHQTHHAAHGHGHSPAHLLRHLPGLSRVVRILRSRVATSPVVSRNFENGLVTLLAGAGFADAREIEHLDHRFGRVTFVQATRP